MLDIPWFPNYKLIEWSWDIVSINFKRTWKEKILKAPVTTAWYKRLNLYENKVCTTICIHEIVALVFHWEKPIWYIVNHIDWNKWNNNPDNLEYTTYSGNLIHSINVLGNKYHFHTHKLRHNLWRFWSCHSFSKPVMQITKQWEFIKEFDSTMSAERETWICHSHIWKVCCWKARSAWWFIWTYLS